MEIQSMTATELLQTLITTESFSRNEAEAAEILLRYLAEHGVAAHRYLNNVWATNQHFDATKPTLLLNSHLDTVKPNKDWSRNPFAADIEDGKLYGLGSNDAGGCLVSLAASFLHFYARNDLHINLLFAASAEEEISGANGIAALVPELPPLACAIVGEPTEMQLAVAEKGLMVLYCTAIGKSGHAARNEGINAIDIAARDIAWLHDYRFEKQSPSLGPVKMTVTLINAGTQHNVVPDRCEFTVDVRTTDAYTNDETLEIIRQHLRSEVEPRSLRLQPSAIDMQHPLVRAGLAVGMSSYGSPTLSDQSLLRIPSIKLGPGSSSRSHTADEFIYVREIEEGIEQYIQLMENFNNEIQHETVG